MHAARRSALAGALALVAPTSVDQPAAQDFLACVLEDDCNEEEGVLRIAPFMSSVLGDNDAGTAAATAIVHAWHCPEGHEPPPSISPSAGVPRAACEVVLAPTLPECRMPCEQESLAQPLPQTEMRPTPARLSQAERRRVCSGGGGGGSVGNATHVRGQVLPRSPPPLSLPPTSLVRHAGPTPPARICRHFLAEGCFRSDCPFSHAISQHVCRFWASPSGCAVGEECAFRHDVEGLSGDVREIGSSSWDAGRGQWTASSVQPTDAARHAQAYDKGETDEVLDPEGPHAEDVEWMLCRLVEEEDGVDGLTSRGDANGTSSRDSREPDERVDVSGGLLGEAEESGSTRGQLDATDLGAFPALQPLGVLPAAEGAFSRRPRGQGASHSATLMSDGGALACGEKKKEASIQDAALALLAALRAPARARSAAILHADGNTVAPPSAAAWQAMGARTGDHLATAVLCRAFPGLPPSTVAAAVAHSGGEMGLSGGGDVVREAAAILQREFGVAPLEGALEPTPQQGQGRSDSRSMPARRPPAVSVATATSARAIAASLARVSTGVAVSALYARSRQGAAALAKARNLALHRATTAYIAGDRARAARFGRQGRELHERMRAAHAAAAAAIFSERNAVSGNPGTPLMPLQASTLPGAGGSSCFLPPAAALQGASGPLPVHVFDLHGLHPAEAAAVAQGVLAPHVRSAGARAPDGGVWFAFLTGTRSHSQRLGKGGGSIHDALLAELEASGGLEVCHPPTAGGGVIIVRTAL